MEKMTGIDAAVVKLISSDILDRRRDNVRVRLPNVPIKRPQTPSPGLRWATFLPSDATTPLH